MKNEKMRTAHVAQFIFTLLILGVLAFWIIGEIRLPAEASLDYGECHDWNDGWKQVKGDGSKEWITLPVYCEVEPGGTVYAEKRLPDKLKSGTTLCFRSSQQEYKIYIGDELRRSYSTAESRPFGSYSTSAYLFVNLDEEDQGKTVRIECSTSTMYAGYVNTVYFGDNLGIVYRILKDNRAEAITLLLMLLVGLITVIVSFILRIRFRKDIALEYLGWGIVIAAVWILSESKLRQFIFPNISVMSHLAFMAVMLLPIPFLLYADIMQNYRYHRWYRVVYLFIFVEIAVCTTLQFLEIREFVETMYLMHIAIGLSALLVVVTVCKDAAKGCFKEYWHGIVGLFGMVLAGAVEIALIYMKDIGRSGIALSFGLLFLLVVSGIKTGQELLNVEKEKERALQDVRSKDLFLANMSHEIRTPINTMMGMNEMILRESSEPAIREYAQNVQNSSKMLLSLVNDILDFSKLESGNLQIIVGRYQLAPLLKDVIYVLRERASNKQLEVVVDIDKELPSVLEGDEIRIKQILINLMTNAVKYTSEGTITFRVEGRWNEKKEFSLVLSVADTGEGIKKQNIDKLFQRFTRLEEKKNKSIEGTGLGLSITKYLIDAMKGKISAQSEYGQGSVFTVVIPQKILEETPVGDISVECEQAAGEYKGDGQTFKAPEAKILVVDDNEMNLAVVKGLLKYTQMEIDTATGGRQCLELTGKKKYHLILMDHMMPELDGVQTLHMLRKEKENPNADTKVIALTANALTGIKDKYLAAGFTDYLSKPIEIRELENMLIEYLPEDLIQREEGTTEAESKPEAEPKAETEADVPEIDREQGLMYCGGMDELYQEMLGAYCEQAAAYIPQLTDYYRKEDWENYRIVVHAVKSNSLSIGAAVFSEKAKAQEMAAKEGRIDDIRNTWKVFMADYKAVAETVRKLYEESR